MVSKLEKSLTSQAKWLLYLLQKSPISPAKNPILTHVCSHKVIVEVHGQYIGKESYIASKRTLHLLQKSPIASIKNPVLKHGCFHKVIVELHGQQIGKEPHIASKMTLISSTKEPYLSRQEWDFDTRVLSQGDCWGRRSAGVWGVTLSILHARSSNWICRHRYFFTTDIFWFTQLLLVPHVQKISKKSTAFLEEPHVSRQRALHFAGKCAIVFIGGLFVAHGQYFNSNPIHRYWYVIESCVTIFFWNFVWCIVHLLACPSNPICRFRTATFTINTLQHTATHCNTLQHTATHYNTLIYCPSTRLPLESNLPISSFSCTMYHIFLFLQFCKYIGSCASNPICWCRYILSLLFYFVVNFFFGSYTRYIIILHGRPSNLNRQYRHVKYIS